MMAIQSLMQKKGQFDQIVLETTGLADPTPIIQAFWNEPTLCLGESSALNSKRGIILTNSRPFNTRYYIRRSGHRR